VSGAGEMWLAPYSELLAAEQAEAERAAREETERTKAAAAAERTVREQAERNRLAAEQAEADRAAREEAERTKAAAAAQRKAREQAERERLAAEQAEKVTQATKVDRTILEATHQQTPTRSASWKTLVGAVVFVFAAIITGIWYAEQPRKVQQAANSTERGETNPSSGIQNRPTAQASQAAKGSEVVQPQNIAAGEVFGKVNSYTFARSFQGSSGEVFAVAFNPKDQTLVSAGRGSKVNVWNVSTGQLLRTLHHEDAWCVAFNRDGTLLASGGLHTAAQLWNATTGEPVAKLGSPVEDDSVYAMAFSPDGRLLAWGDTTQPKQGQTGLQYKVSLWNVANRGDVVTLQGRESMGLAFTPDGRRLAAAGDTGLVTWNTATWKEDYTINIKGSAMAISPDGSILASGGEDKTVTIVETANGHRLRALTGITGKVRALAFSPDGSLLAVGAWGEVRLWRTQDWTLAQTLPHNPPPGSIGSGVNGLAFSPDGHWLATGGQDKTHLRLWQAEN
jgi:WD40 repeat protein